MYELKRLILCNILVSEVCGTIFLKYSSGFEIWYYGVLSITFYGLAIYLLSLSLAAIELGIAYSIWSGIGTAAAVVLGVFLFQEPLLVIQYVGIIVIVGGVVLINVGPMMFLKETEN